MRMPLTRPIRPQAARTQTSVSGTGQPSSVISVSVRKLPTAKTEHQYSLPGSMANMAARSQLAPASGIDLPAILAQLTKPLVPYLKRIRYERHGPRNHEPRDVLIPPGFTVDVVATGLNTPVACCFDDAGMAYVVEGGHKVGATPRILRIDPADGRTAGRIAFEVRESLRRWEPRIEVADVRVDRHPSVADALLLEISYTASDSNDPRNLVFPFYLIPGED